MDTRTKSSVLHALLRKPFRDESMLLGLDEDSESMEVKYEKCLEVILELDGLDDEIGKDDRLDRELRSIINSVDEFGNTPLHYATQLWSQSVVRLLLERGSNIGIKNVYDDVPVENILPETMEAFLDEFCLVTKGDPTNKDFRVTARYDFLAPPRENPYISTRSLQMPLGESSSLWPRNGRVTSNSPGNDDTEKQKPEECCDQGDEASQEKIPLPEADVLWQMSQSKQHRHLLKHPVITSFLWLKWNRISSAYSKNLLFYFAFVACMTGYIFALYGGRSLRSSGVLQENCSASPSDGQEEKQTLRVPSDVHVLWYINTVLLVLLFIRELLQFGVAPRRYFFSIENCLEVLLIALSAFLLFQGGFGCHVSAKRHVAAVIIILSWSEFITMIGRHPTLSTYNIYVTMFYKVTSTFILFLAWYSLFIFAFGLGFYILLHKDDGHDVSEDDYIYFDFLGLCLVKTFTMFVGELEFADLPIETPVGYLFFLAFIFLIVVVMMNLLNGLAVSDTGVIKDEAEINYYVCQVEVISYVEAMMLGDPFNFLANWPSYIWLRKIPACSLGNILYRIPPLRTFFHKITGAKGILLFYDYLPEKQITFYPNQERNLCACLRTNRPLTEAEFPSSVNEAAKATALSLIKAKDGLDERMSRTERMLVKLTQEHEALSKKIEQLIEVIKQ